MTEFETASAVFFFLLAASGFGVFVRPLLPKEHTAFETVQLLKLVIGMLVTFAALVLGLLTASAKTLFDTTNNDIRTYATALIQLDNSLRQYGPDADSPRQILRAYTAAAIASTWTQEPPPPGDYFPKTIAPDPRAHHLDSRELGGLLERAQREVRELQPRDPYHQRLDNEALIQFNDLIEQRWKIVEEARGSISTPFDHILVFWLVVIFLCFGLIAPRNALALVLITLGALSIASAVLVILDLDTPFTGSILVPSQPLRDALAYLSR
ncbi:hypothetical protein AWB64_00536 [Caballeronia sordidicola]|uniref:DUF4239 domain-containing protein n=1 Tax=Caballeronia sordidicola TaxID=196367 RepID=A0A158EYJ4_CABSO|nr:DUF4239 domain-containing protein [Caballeronia sordidicola]SAL12631.1 hypothetical protein AWB64_00536 [Caballeronia sordidicola]